MSSKNNPAVSKAIAVVQYVADSKEPVSVKELSYALEVPQASCYRIVRTLLEKNWLRQDMNGGLSIAFGLAHVARGYSDLEMRLKELDAPVKRLASELNMSVKLTLREGHYATTALRAESINPNAITTPVGSRFHLAVGSAAAALLSQLSDREIELGLDSAPKEVWPRQTREHVWERVRACREYGVCADLGLQHPAIYAASTLLKITDSLVVALTAVGWQDDFEGEKLQAVFDRLLRASDTIPQLL
ncbi:helix-turn-helix domain-containing protein [Coraliomargarita algicola]|uniref:Helix-turn-helix domain-containing protein n=1 Tax=Coraliomargarita algicola TaxID=3092156 RepID=A0ABZ0RGM2_9BACT|nr:helix-turn-helix domain-containing protein [Coraliomargarita sp. J2-16]WPJ95177.1 helix-turn-helix domain-containing protein [Coraliomargarita sp. J2-16]